MYNIGRFNRLGVSGNDISNLLRLTPHSNDTLRPNRRGYVYRGTLRGVPIVIKPYENGHEADVVKVVSRSPFSLMLDQNDRYLLEVIAQGMSLESAYASGKVRAEDVGARLGTFIATLHKMGINHNHTHEDHLFVEGDGLKATDFGEARLDKPVGFVDDIVIGLEYLRDTLSRQDLPAAVEAFRKQYAANYDNAIFLEATKRHLRFAQQNDPLRSVFS